MEDSPPYPTGPADDAEPPLTTEALVAAAHANRQGIPYEAGTVAARCPSGCAPAFTRRQRTNAGYPVAAADRRSRRTHPRPASQRRSAGRNRRPSSE